MAQLLRGHVFLDKDNGSVIELSRLMKNAITILVSRGDYWGP